MPGFARPDGPKNWDSLDRELRIIRWSCRAPECRSNEGPPPVNDANRDLHGIGWSEPVEEPAARRAERAIPAVRRDQGEAAQRLVPDPIPDGKAHEASGGEIVFHH